MAQSLNPRRDHEGAVARSGQEVSPTPRSDHRLAQGGNGSSAPKGCKLWITMPAAMTANPTH